MVKKIFNAKTSGQLTDDQINDGINTASSDSCDN